MLSRIISNKKRLKELTSVKTWVRNLFLNKVDERSWKYPQDNSTKTEVREEDFDKSRFYADPETLKEGSGYYDYLKSLEDVKGEWFENCANCRRPMFKVMIQPGNNLRGIVSSVSGITVDPRFHPKQYKTWILNPVINPASTFWYCEGCESIWVIAEGCFWTKISINGISKIEKNLIEKVTPNVQEVKVADVFDPGPAPTKDSTQCPSCLSWRVIEPYNETHIQHVCKKCKTVTLFKMDNPVVASVQE